MLDQKQELWLRIKVVGVCPVKNTMTAVHRPILVPESKNETSEKAIVKDGVQDIPYGVLNFRLAGLDYPLPERAIKELLHPQTRLFSQNRYVLLSHKEVMVSDSDESLPVWLE